MKEFTLQHIAKLIGAELRGNAACTIQGVAPIHCAKAHELTYVIDVKKYRSHLNNTQASAVIMQAEPAITYKGNALVVKNPELAFGRIAAIFDRFPLPTPG